MRKYIVIMGLLLVPLLLSAQSLLWKISGKGLEHPAYLLGTYHIIEGTFLDSIPGYAAVFSKAEQVIKEVDDAAFAQSAGQIRRIVRMPGDTTLRDLMTKQDYRFVKKKFRELTHINLFFFKKMKPVMVCLYIQNKISKESIIGRRGVTGMDSSIEKEARKENKRIVGVDDMYNVLKSYFNAFSLRGQADALVAFVKNPQSEVTDSDVFKIYKHFDLEEIQKLIITGMSPVEYALLVEGRNDYWMEKLVVLIHERPSLIAVGAGHLPGNKGLLSQFKNLGYTVEPVLE